MSVEELYEKVYGACLEAAETVDMRDMSWFGKNHAVLHKWITALTKHGQVDQR